MRAEGRGGPEVATRCALYLRLSKEDADRGPAESESIQNQRALLLGYAAERGWAVESVYCDEDYSGADSLRPAFNRMLAAAREGRFSVVLCKSQSRFTRDLELVEKYIHGLFPLWGIRFIAVADNADTEVRGNKKARQINGLVNQWYLEDLSENVRMVLDLKRRQGQYIGARPLYGYQKDPADKNRLVVDPEAAAVVRQIFRWAGAGMGKQAIAHRLNDQGVPSPARYRQDPAAAAALWSKTAVWRILRNEMYTGVMVQGRRRKVSYKSRAVVDVPAEQWFRVEGTHEAIVSRPLFDAVQQSLSRRARSDGTGDPHPLAGLARCMDCGCAMTKATNASPGRPPVSYLRCRQYADSGKDKRCASHSVRLDRLEELVLQRIKAYASRFCPPEALPQEPLPPPRAGRERRALAAQVQRQDQALEQLYLDKVSGVLSQEEFTFLSRRLWAEKNRLEERLAQLSSGPPAETPPPVRRQAAERRLMELERLPRALAVLLIEKVEVGQRDPATGRQEIRITWRFRTPPPLPEGMFTV